MNSALTMQIVVLFIFIGVWGGSIALAVWLVRQFIKRK